METVSISQLHAAHTPTETLARQTTGLGRRIHLFVKANAACCLYGGTESLLKHPLEATASSSGSNNSSSHEEGNRTSSTTAEDPFSFLEQPDAAATTASTTTTTDESVKKRGIGRFLKKVAQTTTQSLERGMHTLAVRADQGRNPDMLVVALYAVVVQTPNDAYNDPTMTLLGLTEAVPLPVETARFQGLRFVVPLVVPSNHAAVVLKLWVRSGASLLNQKTALGKYYLLGATRWDPSTFAKQMQHQNVAHLSLDLQSTVVVGGKLAVTATADRKIPPLTGRGWSLADPAPEGYFGPPAAGQQPPQQQHGPYHVPLDQSYGLSFPAQPASVLVATERVSESTLVLPTALACAHMYHSAAQVSVAHIQAASQQAWARRCDAPMSEHAAVQVQVGSLLASIVPASLQHCLALVTVSLEAPDCLLAVDLVAPVATPVVATPPPTFASVAHFTCYPKTCRNPQRVLPGLLLDGKNLPACGYLLGCLLVQVSWIPKGQAQQGNPYAPEQVWSARLALEPLVGRNHASNDVLGVSLLDAQGSPLGTLAMQVSAHLAQGQAVPDVLPSPDAGLVSRLGFPNVVMDGLEPQVDFANVVASLEQPTSASHALPARFYGPFLSYAYLEYHHAHRTQDAQVLQARVQEYGASLAAAAIRPPHETRVFAVCVSGNKSTLLLGGLHYIRLGQSIGLCLQTWACARAARSSCMVQVLFFNWILQGTVYIRRWLAMFFV